ncbi:hypothetical protein LCGC14_1335970 [marine sediment metagenome]|uniref:Uncharacterized protein n=1 Tax=marine sediment metagenome TaxID=412755 RepID=A0A0F9L192_9ZZZZ
MPEKFDRIVKAIKESLRKSHPKWDSDKINTVAFATATVRWKEKFGNIPRR